MFMLENTLVLMKFFMINEKEGKHSGKKKAEILSFQMAETKHSSVVKIKIIQRIGKVGETMEWRNVGVLDNTEWTGWELSVRHELKWARLNGSVFFSSHIQS